jgi:hypothetical protein
MYKGKRYGEADCPCRQVALVLAQIPAKQAAKALYVELFHILLI